MPSGAVQGEINHEEQEQYYDPSALDQPTGNSILTHLKDTWASRVSYRLPLWNLVEIAVPDLRSMLLTFLYDSYSIIRSQ